MGIRFDGLPMTRIIGSKKEHIRMLIFARRFKKDVTKEVVRYREKGQPLVMNVPAKHISQNKWYVLW